MQGRKGAKLMGVGINIIVLAFPNGALARNSDPVAAMGYAQTNVGRPLVIEALNIANSILASRHLSISLLKGGRTAPKALLHRRRLQFS
jgi:hypothetical protein